MLSCVDLPINEAESVELSKGKYVKWFDSDDLMSPNLLQIQLVALFVFM